MQNYDVIIIGDGPAALAAAINLQIRGKSFLLMGSLKGSEKVVLSPLIDNYLGLPEIKGPQLMQAMASHAQSMGVVFSNLKANQVFSMGETYIVTDKNNQQHQAKAVIVATGVSSGKAYEGEEPLIGRGVSYCATCDGLFFKNKTIVVLGQNEEAIHEANFLATLTDSIYFVPLKKLSGELDPKIQILLKKIISIQGATQVEKIVFSDMELPCDGIFILRDASSPNYLIPGIETQNNHIKVDAEMKTNLKGLFAAGDCVGRPYQLLKAVGQGQTAALNSVNYLDEHK